jgi:peptidoglycan/LPS O-acetylase OafA/YrhL
MVIVVLYKERDGGEGIMVKRFNELDSLRGLAALMVLLMHYTDVFPSIAKKVSGFGDIYYIIISNGHAAVILFFVLSGFVLSLPFYEKRSFHYSSFIIKRICRIYLPYVIIIFVAIGLRRVTHWNIGHFSSLVVWAKWNIKITPRLILNHILFLGEYNYNALVMVIWSLVHEMRISLIFPFVVMLLLRVNWKISLIIALALSGISFTLIDHFPTKFNDIVSTNYFVTLHYTAMFIIGALLAKHRESLINITIKYKLIYIYIPVSFICFTYPDIPYIIIGKLLGSVNYNIYLISLDWIIAIGSALIVLLALSSSMFSKFLLKKPVHFLGEISYSLYLVHPVVLISIVQILDNKLPHPLILIISFVLAICFSWLFHQIVEVPSIRLGKILTQNRNGRIMGREKVSA